MLKKFERLIVYSLISMMVLVVLLATVDLGRIIVQDIISPPRFLLEIDEVLEIFGYFLLVLIGVELLDTIRAYLVEGVVHAEIVLEVALIAVARKVIILDVKEMSPLALIGIAALVITLAAAYHLHLERRRRSLASAPAQASEKS